MAIRRFVIRAVILSLVAAVVWFAAAPWLRASAIVGAKAIHQLVGFPAPHLLSELDGYYWFAPLFPPLVGLVLASSWVSPTRRIAGLAFGLAAFWYLVSLQISIVYSPYLTLSATRAYLTSIYVGLNTVVVPVSMWLIVTGGPVFTPPKFEGAPHKSAVGSKPIWQFALTALLCGIFTIPVIAAVGETTPSITSARRNLGRAIDQGNDIAAINTIDQLLVEQGSNAALSFLKMRILEGMGDVEAAANLWTDALTSRRRRDAERRLKAHDRSTPAHDASLD